MTNKMTNILLQFNYMACALHLSGRQMQMWICLWESIALFQKQDVVLHTPSLLQKLQLDKRQFVRVRQGLIDAGFLSIRHDNQQRVFYTLLLNNKPIAMAQSDETPDCNTTSADSNAKSACLDKFTKPVDCKQLHANRMEQIITMDMASNNTADTKADYKPKASGQLSYNDYKDNIEDFCQIYEKAGYINDLRRALLDWADMRLKNGWRLTSWGLAILLENLQEIGAGSIDNMTATVQKSIRKGWKGFFSYHADCKPSGKAFCKQDGRQSNIGYAYNKPKPWQKAAPEGRDLSFLEK